MQPQELNVFVLYSVSALLLFAANVANYESGREQATQNPEIDPCVAESLQVYTAI